MKRSEIVGLLDMAGQLMDSYERAEIRDRSTGETIGIVPDGDIKDMQTGIAFCKQMLVDTYKPANAVMLANDMIMFHGAVKFGLDADESEGVTLESSEDGADD